jgi:hypothetical protein
MTSYSNERIFEGQCVATEMIFNSPTASVIGQFGFFGFYDPKNLKNL